MSPTILAIPYLSYLMTTHMHMCSHLHTWHQSSFCAWSISYAEECRKLLVPTAWRCILISSWDSNWCPWDWINTVEHKDDLQSCGAISFSLYKWSCFILFNGKFTILQGLCTLIIDAYICLTHSLCNIVYFLTWHINRYCSWRNGIV